jgi:hypothetical protein
MTEPKAFPHARVRSAIFWILILTWPAVRIIAHVWHPEWVSDVADVGAGVTVLAFLLAKFQFGDVQRAAWQRLDRVEQKVDGYDEAWDLLAPLAGLGPSRSSR